MVQLVLVVVPLSYLASDHLLVACVDMSEGDVWNNGHTPKMMQSKLLQELQLQVRKILIQNQAWVNRCHKLDLLLISFCPAIQQLVVQPVLMNLEQS